MPSLAPRLGALLLAAVLLGAPAVEVGADEGQSSGRCESLTVLEGRVLALGEAPGEGGLPVVSARLEGSEKELLLAPAAVLAELDFELREGDVLRVRVLGAGEPGPAPVHRVLNLTRSRMIRLRTMQQTPLWDGAGHWQGSPGGYRDGSGGGRRHRGGGSGGGAGQRRGGGL
jgi:hypothetical protein